MINGSYRVSPVRLEDLPEVDIPPELAKALADAVERSVEAWFRSTFGRVPEKPPYATGGFIRADVT
jgi:hypothetical protein